MAKYKAYPEYKDSGVEWLGEVPNQWKTIAISRLFSRNKRTGYTEKELLSVYRDYGVIPKSSRDDNNNKPSEDLSPYQLVEPNDLVMNKMKAWQGSIAISEYEGIVSPAYFVYQPNTMFFEMAYPRYVHYLLRNSIYVTQYLSRSKGIRVNQWDLDPDEFRNIELLLPSKSEQEKIYEFLDHETAKIDNLIEKQQQLIELLKEKRQAVISHAVTKGLNPDVPMQDSGVEWLGEVPEHWTIPSLGCYATLNTGSTPDRSNPDYWNGDVPWIKTGEVNYRVLFSAEEGITPEAVRDTSVRISPPGTLLMAMYGQGITRGRVAILGVSATYNQACVAISPNDSIFNLYLELFFIAGYHAIRDGGNETSQMNLNADIVRKFKILIPPMAEQIKIVSYLNAKLPKIDFLLENAESVIGLLQERRTALISAAVTGKIDVRDWVAPATQNTEESAEVSV